MRDRSTALQHSRVYQWVQEGRTAIKRAIEHSTVAVFAGRVTSVFGHATRTSETSELLRLYGRWVRGSWLYRWFTAEPDSDVIVIDLRETYTVGPILDALDRGIETVGNTTVADAGRRRFASLEDLVASRPVQITSAMLLVALITRIMIAAALGDLGPRELGYQLFVLAALLLGLRVTQSSTELRKTWLGRALAALFTPPDIEDEARTRDDAAGENREATEREPGRGEP